MIGKVLLGARSALWRAFCWSLVMISALGTLANSGMDSKLATGVDLYWRADYSGALARLREIDSGQVDVDTRVLIHKFLGLSLVALKNADEAKAEFRKLLSIEPSFRLPPADFSPEVLEIFRSARAELAEAGTLDGMAAFEAANFRLSVEVFERVLKLDPDRPLAADLLPIARSRLADTLEPPQESPPCIPTRAWRGLKPDGGDCRPVDVSNSFHLPMEVDRIELIYDRHHFGVGKCWRLVLYDSLGNLIHSFDDPEGNFSSKAEPSADSLWQAIDLSGVAIVSKIELYADHRHGGSDFLARRVGMVLEDHFILSLGRTCAAQEAAGPEAKP